MAWVEGLTNSSRVLHSIANILTTSNKTQVTKFKDKVSGSLFDYHLVGTVLKDSSNVTVPNPTNFVEIKIPTTTPDPLKNWTLVYPTNINDLLDPTKTESHPAYVCSVKRLVLKTCTTPVTVDNTADEYETDPDLRVDRLNMFVEFIKPMNCINPESAMDVTINTVTKTPITLENNHYIDVRMGDKYIIDSTLIWDSVLNIQTVGYTLGADGKIYDAALAVVTDPKYVARITYGNDWDRVNGAHISEFSKYSWYKDFEEIMKDTYDADPSTDDITDGVILLPTIIPGMTDIIPIQFWINSTNDRVSMVLMGDPTLDYEHYLCSFAYIGKIDNFEGSCNDTAGNFSLTVGSATIPSARPKAKEEPINGMLSFVPGEATSGPINTSTPATLTFSRVSVDDTHWVIANAAESDPSKKVYHTGFYANGIVPATGSPEQKTSARMTNLGYKFTTVSVLADGSLCDQSYPSAVQNYTVFLEAFKDQGTAGTVYNGALSGANAPIPSTRTEVLSPSVQVGINLPLNSDKLRVWKSVQASFGGVPDLNFQGTRDQTKLIPYDDASNMYLYKEIVVPTTVGQKVTDDSTYLITCTGLVKDFGGNTVGYHVIYCDLTLISTFQTLPEGDANKRQAPNSKKVSPTGEVSVASVSRDILGFVTSVKFSNTWGRLTATGVSDIAMYKSRSGVYYQRHFSSFITPEEYMEKDAFNPSRWTGKFHLSPLYVVHGYDGYRGWFKDAVIVDDTSIVHLDELIVNKGSQDKTKPEEVYKYFSLSSPFSFLNNSPNYNYGIGILKSRRYWDVVLGEWLNV